MVDVKRASASPTVTLDQDVVIKTLNLDDTLQLNDPFTLKVSDAVNVMRNGVIKGNGLISGDVNNQGMLTPGLSIGVVNIDGQYTQTGTLAIEISGTDATLHDQLLVSGSATLNGLLNITLPSYTPEPGDYFDVLIADEIIDNGISSNMLQWAIVAGDNDTEILRVYTVADCSVSLSVGPPRGST